MKGLLAIAALAVAFSGALAKSCPKELGTTLLPDFRSCAGFWQCADGYPLLQFCPQGLHFSARLQRCTLPVFARCQAAADDTSMHTALKSGILDALHNLVSRKTMSVPLAEDTEPNVPEPPVEAYQAEGDIEEVEEVSANEEKKSTGVEVVEGELLIMEEEMDQEENKENGNEEEQENEQPKEQTEEEEDEEGEPEEKIDEMSDVEDAIEEEGKNRQDSKKGTTIEKDEAEEEEDDEEESAEKINETSEVEDVVAENDGENRPDSKKDVTVVKKEDEEEEDEKKKPKDVKSIRKDSKKNKSEEKEKDSGSDDESEDEK